MKAVAVIPARYGSTRLPGKPLLDICGKPLIQRVWEVVSRVHGLDKIIVATDDERIAEVVRGFGGKALMTSADCQSGSDRVREVAQTVDADVYVNVQGDEPLLEPSAIEKLLEVFAHDSSVQVATLCSSISQEEAQSPNQVKVVRDHAGNALYFSRASLPFVREANEKSDYFGHIGSYAYRKEALCSFTSLPASSLEQAEKLEQLRFLQAGIPIRVIEVPKMGVGVDTQQDLERVRTVVREKRKAEALERLKHVKLVVTDVDGVLTDGGLYYGPDGEYLKRFNAKDGLGVKLLQKAGIHVAIISGRDCFALRKRINDLGITDAILGQLDKQLAISKIKMQYKIKSEEVVFIGDDIPDMNIFDQCGVSVTVNDAPEYVKNMADIILNNNGGNAVFREIVDLIIKYKM